MRHGAGRRIVVGALLVRDGLILAAQRAHPPAVAGRWELPGGGVEVGESEAAALARECREELGVAVRVGERFGPDVTLDDGRLLRVYVCALHADHTGSTEPTAHEHLDLRWLAPAELGDLDWLPADRAVFAGVSETHGDDANALEVELRRRAPS